MKSLIALFMCASTVALAMAQTPVSSGWTYQGRLHDTGVAADGLFDMQFELFDDATAGAKIGSTLTLSASDPNSSPVTVEDGLFNVELDFGVDALNGDARWLQVAVRASGGGSYFTLTPRQPVTGAPYALQTRGIFVDENNNVGIGTTTPSRNIDIEATESTLRLTSTSPSPMNVSQLQLKSYGSSAFTPFGLIMFLDESDAPRAIIAANASGASVAQINMTVDPGQLPQMRVLDGSVRVKGELEVTRPSDGATSASIGAEGADSYFQLHGGDVGIGTSSPDANLQVVGDGAGTVLKITNGGGGSQTNTGLIISDVANTGRAASFYGVTSNTLVNVTNDGTGRAAAFGGDVTFSGGTVGIGTSTPSAQLHVVGDGVGAVLKLTNGGSTANTALAISDIGGTGRAASFYGVTTGDLFRAQNDGDGRAAVFSARNDHAIETTVNGNANALRATNTATTGVRSAIRGEANSTAGRGVEGVATAATGGTSYGVYGESNANSSGSAGVRGNAFGDNTTYGVYGRSFSSTGVGVYGFSKFGVRGESGTGGFDSKGVYGASGSNDGAGVHGHATSGNNSTGIWGTNDSNGWAGYFQGHVFVSGTLSAETKNFMIDNPLNPEEEYLVHNCVESDEMKNVYDGVATLNDAGDATIELPDWFSALNGHFRYQLTCIGGYAPVYIAREIVDNQFVIAGGKDGMKVSWQVTGVRIDPAADRARMPTVITKPAEEQGRYLNPAAYGAPAEARVGRHGNARLEVMEATDRRDR